jgi:hypothetical protein
VFFSSSPLSNVAPASTSHTWARPHHVRARPQIFAMSVDAVSPSKCALKAVSLILRVLADMTWFSDHLIVFPQSGLQARSHTTVHPTSRSPTHLTLEIQSFSGPLGHLETTFRNPTTKSDARRKRGYSLYIPPRHHAIQQCGKPRG